MAEVTKIRQPNGSYFVMVQSEDDPYKFSGYFEEDGTSVSDRIIAAFDSGKINKDTKKR